MSATSLAPSRLRPADLLRLGGVGLRTRRLRAALSALGIAIGIAAMVAVLGISQSSKAALLAQLDRLGTNLLQVTPGQTFGGQAAELPLAAPGMIRRIGPVRQVTTTGYTQASIYRNNHVDPNDTGGLTVQAASLDLLGALGVTVHQGRWLDRATERYPAVVLGSAAATQLGIDRVGVKVWLGGISGQAGHWFTVIGILDPNVLVPELDRAAFVGYPIAAGLLGHDGHPSTVYLRADPDQVGAVENVLAATANPENPNEVNVSRPSDALAARVAAKSAFTTLFLGLGAVALLVGGVGIANVMVIAVLERRSEIGLRRALGATKRHIAAQFLAESQVLSLLGGVAGVAFGALVVAGYAANRGWAVEVPPVAVAGGLAAALLIGAVAGLYPAVRAARLSPTDALRTV